MASYLNELDAIKADLEARFPDWQIWYVPHINRTVTWCARPWPLLNEYSPEDLAEAIGQAMTEASQPRPPEGSIPPYHGDISPPLGAGG